MEKPIKKIAEAIKRLPVGLILSFLLIATCVVTLLCVSSGKAMASDAISPTVNFVGEYKIEDGAWEPLTKTTHVSSTKGDVTIKGKFVLSFPDGEFITDNPEGLFLNFYCNHLSVLVKFGDEEILLDSENPYIGKEACGAFWCFVAFPVGTDGTTEIVFSNPHGYGNEMAIDQFLDNVVVDEPSSLANNIAKKYDTFRYIGFTFMALALVLFGFATVSLILKLKAANTLWIIGAWMFFTGGFYVLDVIDVFLWNANAVFNTAALCFCEILSTFFLGVFVTGCLTGVRKRVATIANVVMGALIAVATLLAAFGVINIFNVSLYWQIAQLAVIILLLTCGIREMFGQQKGVKVVLVCCMACLLFVVIDFLGLAFAWWHTLYISKIFFGVVFIIVICFGIYTVIYNYKMSIKSKEMEAELKDKSIAVMISQIQPHFLYNSLNSIAELCVVDPRRAEKATIDFSRYLRGNMGALNEKNTIEFEDELNHLNHYIELEKLRYGDDLQFEYDIRETGFTIPALTVQPLVENAVNHGIRYHKMKGRVKISSYSNETDYCVVIEDDGVGFDPDQVPSDGKKHVGISNVKYRLSVMCGGRVEIQSTKGKGTMVTILIPKERQ